MENKYRAFYNSKMYYKIGVTPWQVIFFDDNVEYKELFREPIDRVKVEIYSGIKLDGVEVYEGSPIEFFLPNFHGDKEKYSGIVRFVDGKFKVVNHLNNRYSYDLDFIAESDKLASVLPF